MKMILAFLKYLPMILKAFGEIWQFVKSLDEYGVKRFSRESALIARAHLIYLGWRISQGQDKGWLKQIKADNALAAWLQTLLDSGRMDGLLKGDTLTREQILAHLRDMQDMSKAVKAV